MLCKRIIPCLDIKNGRTVKGTHFVDLRDAGDAVQLAAAYRDQGADELVFLDITATNERRQTVTDFATQVGKVLDIPFTIGGGIRTVADARSVLLAGADKVAINSAAVRDPDLITRLADAFGRQAVVLSIDAKKMHNGVYHVHTHGGREDTGIDVMEWVRLVQEKGAGEILLTSIDADGTQAGFNTELYTQVRPICHVPLVASGGAGQIQDFVDVLRDGTADAALAASLFHFGHLTVPDLKQHLRQEGVPVR